MEAMIQSHPAVMMGKPVVAGTRITVESILERLGTGESVEALLEAHTIVERLRAHGHHVVYVAELEPGIPDDVVLSKATELSAP